MGENMDSLVSSTLGRCSYLIIYDSDRKRYTAVPNPGILLKDGSGVRAVEVIAKSGVEVLLTKKIGIKAYSVLAKERIIVLIINEISSIDEAIRKYLKK